MKFKVPFSSQLRKLRWSKPKPAPKAFNVTARRTVPNVVDEYDSDVPTARFSTAFFVVLVIHVFFLGGIYAFKSIKANRAPDEAASTLNPPATPNQSASEPLEAGAAASPPLTTAPAPGDPSLPAFKVYHAKAGDTWQKVASQYNVGSAELADFNGLKETTVLHPGQTLNIPTSKTAVKTAAADPHAAKKPDDATAKAGTPAIGKTYTVKKGDNPVAIARNMNVSYAELLKLNKIDDPKKLQIGTVLKLPPSKKQAGT